MKPNWLRQRLSRDELAGKAEELLAAGFRLGLVAAHDDGDRLRVVYLFLAGHPDRRVELESLVPAADPALPSLAYLSFPVSRFEREMADLYGIRPIGHPRPRRLVRHAHWPEDWHPMRTDAGPAPPFHPTGRFPFVTVDGTGVYEIPVGPVHAGLIEPGHFRFSVVGETVLRLKARLWFVHRGLEKLFEGRAATGAADLAERVSGDTSAAHALAHSLAVEDALGVEVPDEAQRLRALLVELERLYNHAADLGALANDVGFGVANGAPAVRVDRTGPDNYWFGARPQIIFDRRGEGVDAMIENIRAAVARYPYPHEYRAWPGPNSNTFTAYIAREVPELGLDLPSNAVGKDFLPGGALFAAAPSGTGFQVSLFGLAGVLLAVDEGLELNVLGLNIGVDAAVPALKLPAIGRLGLDR